MTATNRLINAKRSLVNGNTSATKLIDELESQIKSINRTQNEGAKIRSRAKFFEEGEKPTRFFFSLESTRAAKNSIKSLYDLNGTEVNTQQEIQHAHWNFYSKLYSAEQIDPQIQNEFMSNVPVSLSDDEKSKCDLPLTLREITLAMRGLSKGKTPGSDGLPLEFYIKFCDLLAPHLVDLFNFSLENGSCSPSMQESVTRVIFKKDDPKDLKNWRPISLLNVDYKICSKALANRLSIVLPSIIHEDQTCSVPGRTIFENLSLLRDILDYVNITDETGVLLNLDQEKAFDRVDRNFLLNTLKRFGFGPVFQRWISTLYCNAKMKVLVNGFLTDEIPLERGVRQGDPLSPLLYVLCAEVLACNIRENNLIKGFLLPGGKGTHFNIGQYADDSTLFVKDVTSLQKLFQLLRKYELGTGAKLNVNKTEAMWLGAWRTRTETPLGLTWVNKMKILGVYFSNGLSTVEQENWQPKLSKLEKNLNLWKSRNLSLVGKALIVNTLGASKFWFLAKILPTPQWVILRYKKLVYHYIWGTKIETVSRQTLSAPVKEGGEGIVDFKTKSRALQLSFALSVIEEPNTKVFYMLKYFLGTHLAKLRSKWSHLRDNSSPTAKQPTIFYQLVLSALNDLDSRVRDKNFKFTSKAIYLKFLSQTVASPLLSPFWRAYIGPTLDSDHHWSLVRETFTENYKNDIAWLITLKGIKVRASLRSWGYIDSDKCAYCDRKETIDHCFLNCKRAKGVWSVFSPTLSALMSSPFSANVKTVFFYLWTSINAKSDRLARFIVKTILYSIWFFCNKTTFHNGTDDERAIVRYVRNEISLRLRADHMRLPNKMFNETWIHPNISKLSGKELEILF